MKLEDYKINNPKPLRKASLCFLVQGDEILLAMKKKGFGINRWNGVGGKPEGNEKIEMTMVRETQEEIMVSPISYRQVASLDFYNALQEEWNQQVIVYFADEWRGEPSETEEMAPKWFKKDKLPFEKMWPDDPYWLPLVLGGKFVEAEFLFGKNDIVLDQLVMTK
jgi:ADP-ribose pyrophosphatase YjhB (NUDIX family)